jgi:HPt (histidine-containing phosphotransfer) domain-containing protein
VLTQVQKNQIAEMAERDVGNNISMAASLYKLVEDRNGYEKAEEAVAFYCGVQHRIIDRLEQQAAARDYQISVEA